MIERILTTIVVTCNSAAAYLAFAYYHVFALGIVLIGNAIFIMAACLEIQNLKMEAKISDLYQMRNQLFELLDTIRRRRQEKTTKMR